MLFASSLPLSPLYRRQGGGGRKYQAMTLADRGALHSQHTVPQGARIFMYKTVCK